MPGDRDRPAAADIGGRLRAIRRERLRALLEGGVVDGHDPAGGAMRRELDAAIFGQRGVHIGAEILADRVRVLPADQAKADLGMGLAGSTVLKPSPV